jgi:hypothetical protein
MQWQTNGENYSEKYRHECELRYIASMKLSERRMYLGKVLEKRGVVALNKLKEGLTELWIKTKSTRA